MPSEPHNPDDPSLAEPPMAEQSLSADETKSIIDIDLLQERSPMLDVHAPHQAVHTWKDFFIHIATIVIGLLIAIGLEQTVEGFHHRSEARDARVLLRTEREKNRTSLRFNTYAIARQEHNLLNDLDVLERVRSHTLLPSDRLVLRTFRYGFFDEEWKAIQQNGVIAYLSPEELQGVSYTYGQQTTLIARGDATSEALSRAGAMLRSSAPANLQSTIWNPDGDRFYSVFSRPGEVPDEATAEKAYAPLVIAQDRFSQLSPVDIDSLEHAIRLALVEDDGQIDNCLNI
jgi:hypothetical protein